MVTDITNMFYGASSFNADISNWDVSQVTQMQLMFGADSAFNADISNWDVSQMTYMASRLQTSSSVLTVCFLQQSFQ